MDQYQHARRGAGRTRLYVALIGAGACLMASVAGAADSGPTITEQNICMQKIFGTPVAGSNKLNCTANDIRLSEAISVSPESCQKGDTFDLTATFQTIVTANARYDAGFFFRTDGGANARGTGTNATGTCSLSMLTNPNPSNDPVQQLDGDSCGDLNAGTFEITFTIPDVKCEAAPGTNQLRLPNCTSWHSNQATACTITEPFSTDDAGDFRPDTKSKCVCDDTFTVPVTVEDASLEVTKDAAPTSVPEPGGEVTFTVKIKNLASQEDVIIETIVDDVFGDLGATPSALDPNDCPDLIGDTLTPGQEVSCSFTAEVQGSFGGPAHKDTVEVHASQPSAPQNDLFDTDDATVSFSDAFEDPSVTKTAQSTANCRVDATYQVVVSNNSEIDGLNINSLTDDKFGDITTVHAAGAGVAQVVSTTCNGVGNAFATIDPSGNYTCQFVGRVVNSTCGVTGHTNTVTADVTDDDGVNSTPTDDAIVTVTATP